MDELKSSKNGDITEDELRSFEKDVQKLTDDSIKISMRLLLKRTRTFRSIKPITNKIIESREANALDFCIDEKGVSQRSLCKSHSKVII